MNKVVWDKKTILFVLGTNIEDGEKLNSSQIIENLRNYLERIILTFDFEEGGKDLSAALFEALDSDDEEHMAQIAENALHFCYYIPWP